MSGADHRPTIETLVSPSRSILIEGWRSTTHSLALVNQYQILELLKLQGLCLFHRDAPLHVLDWNRDTRTSGFSAADRLLIDTLSDCADETTDCVYRIFSPFRASAEADRRRSITFIVTELGPFFVSFENGSKRSEVFTRGDSSIVTPTSWSRDRLVDWGFDSEKVSIVPHGVDANHFRPLHGAERDASRKILGFREDEIVFLNVGAAVWNKGIDLLLLAFGHLRRADRRIRLILRDRVDMYGFSVATEIQKLAKKNPGLFIADTMKAVTVVQDDLSRDHLRLLYGSADCYVSPYRAEGFNLPVLEAIACGTPAIVTRGGATDDFCDDRVAVRIRGEPGHHEDAAAGHRGQFITPHLGDLIEAMNSFATRQTIRPDHFDVARERLVQKFSWRNAAIELTRVAFT